MELIPFMGLGLILIILPLAILSGLLILIWKKAPFGKYISVSLAAGFVFVVVIAIWPMDSFYVDELQNNSKLSLTRNYDVLAKNSSYPDMHGDYFSEAVFHVSDLDFSTLAKDVTPLEKCSIPGSVEPFLNSKYGAIKCWSANRDNDEWFTLMYFPDSAILYYRFD